MFYCKYPSQPDMDEELSQCLVTIPSFLTQVDERRYTTDLNLIESFVQRCELYLELLRVLAGKQTVRQARQKL